MPWTSWSTRLLTIAATAVTATSSSSSPRSLQAIDPGDFVYRDGLRLMNSSGPLYLTGMNYWSCMNLASDASVGGNLTRLTTELDQMAAKGINHLRIMASSEGNPSPQPFRMNPPLMDAPGIYNEAIFTGLDRCLDEMSKRGMRATMTLNNFWQWSGGFAQYVSWANDNEPIPYPPSWNLTAPPQRPYPNTGWGNYTQVNISAFPYDTFTSYAAQFYTIPQAQTWFRAHITTLLNRTNTISHRRYATDSTILSWQLANEPQPALHDQQQPLSGPAEFNIYLPTSSANASSDPLIPWIRSTAAFIKSLAPAHLVSVGLESKQGPAYFRAVHEVQHVDYATVHAWVQNWGVYDMLNSSRANLDGAIRFAGLFLNDTAAWAREVGKPVLLEEFGMARDNWENFEKEYSYLSTASTRNKDEYFEAVIREVVRSFKEGGPYIGTAPWAYGGVWRPESMQVDRWGMVWAGDPPHESPGWYDLYDEDEAMEIVWRQQREVEAFLSGGRGGRGVVGETGLMSSSA